MPRAEKQKAENGPQPGKLFFPFFYKCSHLYSK